MTDTATIQPGKYKLLQVMRGYPVGTFVVVSSSKDKVRVTLNGKVSFENEMLAYIADPAWFEYIVPGSPEDEATK